ncbi:hypothetical protein J2W91_004794 [Paenibacillus amylolyticus]|uniref:Uncharacterized protein n=1 Tax=Paenibacillus amylolyticus TaxID=1451 RepID=A0AAP5H7P2_PAEAM|nr:hypothetical protein [Paenibacillus amylolyticus]MDR6726283.1 hypothetical protein [Paenibacillus amylolyticus]
MKKSNLAFVILLALILGGSMWKSMNDNRTIVTTLDQLVLNQIASTPITSIEVTHYVLDQSSKITVTNQNQINTLLHEFKDKKVEEPNTVAPDMEDYFRIHIKSDTDSLMNVVIFPNDVIQVLSDMSHNNHNSRDEVTGTYHMVNKINTQLFVDLFNS